MMLKIIVNILMMLEIIVKHTDDVRDYSKTY